MAVQAPFRNLAGEDLGSVELDEAVFGASVNDSLIHQAVIRLLANQRLGTHKTKTRGEVSGGGAKPWRQKGTGRARQGSRVSPLWRGGGVVFGPVERGYRQEMPKKMRRLAMIGSLSARVADGALMVIDEFVLSEPRTSEMADALRRLGVEREVVIVDTSFDINAALSTRNIRDAELRSAEGLNVLDVLRPAHLVFTKAGVESIERRLSSQG